MKIPVFLCCIIALASCSAVLPDAAVAKTGAKVVLSEQGLNYVVSQYLPLVHDLLVRTAFEDITGRAGSPIGKVDYQLSQLKVQTLNLGTVKIYLKAPSAIQVVATGVSAQLHCKWHYREVGWPHISDTGTADLSVTVNSASILSAVGVDATGHPTLKTTAFSVKIDHIKLKLHGGASWLYSIFTSIFIPMLKGRIEKTIVAKLPPALDALASAQLKTLPIQEPLGFGLGINYALTAAPVVNSFGFSIRTTGEAYAIVEGPGHTPAAPVPLPDGETHHMVDVVLSEWTLGSVAYAAYRADDLSILVTKDMVPAGTPADGFFMSEFYGQYAPGLVEKYGDKTPVALGLSVKGIPQVMTAVNGFTVRLAAEMVVMPFDKPAGKYVKAFTMLEKPYCFGKLDTKGENITGEIEILNSTTSLVDTVIGPVDVEGFTELIDFLMAMGQELVNDFLEHGIPIPAIDGLSIETPRIAWHPGYVTISGNVKFKPKALEAMKLAQEIYDAIQP